MSDMPTAQPVSLVGDARSRGRAQADKHAAGPVIEAIRLRLGERAALFSRPDVRDYLARQWDFAAANCGDELAEMTGVAEGFGIEARDLFDFLHLGAVADFADRPSPEMAAEDGCSAWARAESEEGPALGKNRDFRGEHAVLQGVFLHRDPAWPNGRQVLCVGSLGAPGAYSSGMNSDGLALADTAIATRDHGVGWLRYFLMTRLLARHATVAAALDDIRALTHAGGGSLVLADAGGTLAAVDLGHSRIYSDGSEAGTDPWVARTNHFQKGSVAGATDNAASSSDSVGRLKTLHRVLRSGQKNLTVLREVMASHDGNSVSGLCRHPDGGDARTLSGAVFACRQRFMYFCPGNPCETKWVRYSVA